jgi:hypothetical protein
LTVLGDAVASIRRATKKLSFEPHYNIYYYNMVPVPVPVPTSSPSTGRRLQNSEPQLYDVETNDNRQLQTICPSVQECLTKYENDKIVKVVLQLTVPLPMDVSAEDYSKILLQLLSSQDYFKYLREWAHYYNLPMYYNINSTICGYTSIDKCDTVTPTALPSFNPSALVTALPSTIPSIAPAVAPTFLPS